MKSCRFSTRRSSLIRNTIMVARPSGEGRILIDAKVIRPLLAAWIQELCGISCFWIKCCYVRTFETITFEARKTQILNSIFAAML